MWKIPEIARFFFGLFFPQMTGPSGSTISNAMGMLNLLVYTFRNCNLHPQSMRIVMAVQMARGCGLHVVEKEGPGRATGEGSNQRRAQSEQPGQQVVKNAIDLSNLGSEQSETRAI
jgi:hypothetical protein